MDFQFRFTEPGLDYNEYWALIRPGFPVEICTAIPGFEVDLFIAMNCLPQSSIILNRTTIACELEVGRLFLGGDSMLYPNNGPEVLSSAKG